MANQIFDLLAGNNVRIITDSSNRNYAQVVNGGTALDDLVVSYATSPATSTNSLEGHPVDWEYELRSDQVIIDAAGIKYWGVVSSRPK